MSETKVLTAKEALEAGQMALYNSHEALRAEVERLAQERAEAVAQVHARAAALAAMTAERDHERHEKETVSEASQAAIRFVRAERDKLAERLAQIEALREAMEVNIVDCSDLGYGFNPSAAAVLRKILALLPVRGAGEESK